MNNLYLKFYSLIFISGWGFQEKLILKKLSKLLKHLSPFEFQFNFIKYRIMISHVYLNQFAKIRIFLDEEESKIKNWNPLWTANLWYELGDFDKAINLYDSIINNQNEALGRRYIALQANYYLQNFKLNTFLYFKDINQN